jgi:hypothetical protein
MQVGSAAGTVGAHGRQYEGKRSHAMADERRFSPLPPTSDPDTDALPIPVVPDWETQLLVATRMARLIDRHLDYEAYSRSVVEAEQLSPRRLCPEQRVDLVTDLRAVVGH